MSDQLQLQQQLTASSHALAIKEAEHQLLDAQLAAKRSQLDGLVAHVQRCEAQLEELKSTLGNAQLSIVGPSVKRRRQEPSNECALDSDSVLDQVIGFVGVDSYVLTAGVCRRWRGRYITLCFKTNERDYDDEPEDRLKTNIMQALTSSKRLQWAMDCRTPSRELDLQDFSTLNLAEIAEAIATQCADPIATVCLARVYNVPFDGEFVDTAAAHNKLEYLQWLIRVGCDYNDTSVILAGKCAQPMTPVCNKLYQQCYYCSFTVYFLHTYPGCSRHRRSLVLSARRTSCICSAAIVHVHTTH
jgi:hypothetical protein